MGEEVCYAPPVPSFIKSVTFDCADPLAMAAGDVFGKIVFTP